MSRNVYGSTSNPAWSVGRPTSAGTLTDDRRSIALDAREEPELVADDGTTQVHCERLGRVLLRVLVLALERLVHLGVRAREQQLRVAVELVSTGPA